MIARHFGALKKALGSLKQCYDNELSDHVPRPSFNLDFPYPSTYTCIATSTIHSFTYTSQMNEYKLLFTAAETIDGEKICVKFVRSYSKEVHAHCASNNFAPALKGFEALPGGWYMVIMEMVGEDYCLLSDFEDDYPHGEDIREKLISLHHHHYVHGDIRDVNILVRKDGAQGFKLLDLDWSGRIGEARYPMNVNRFLVWRPDGAKDGELIQADHDIQMLNAMFEDLGPGLLMF
jgi:hypothetical protein